MEYTYNPSTTPWESVRMIQRNRGRRQAGESKYVKEEQLTQIIDVPTAYI